MSQHDPEKYLYDMLEYCDILLQLVQDRGRGDLDNDQMFRLAIERSLMIVGEALFKLDKQFPHVAAQIPEYERIIGFRHILVHNYDDIDRDTVWYVLQTKLPVLRNTLRQLLGPTTGS